MAATMADVARLAGVSKKTVSNYFNDYPYMREATRAAIEQAIAQLNYKVNVSARNLSSGRTGMIGLAIPELAHPYFAELAQAVVTAAQARSLGVLIEVTNGDRDHEEALIDGSRGRMVDGLIFGPLTLDPADIERATLDVPMVLIGDRIYEGRYDFIGVPNVAGANEATEHLLRSGRKRIAVLGVEREHVPTAAAQRFEGYRCALEAAGVAVEDALTVGPIPWTRTAGADAVGLLLKERIAFDAVLGLNDALALGALSELQRRGVVVPDDVAVVGFDDVEEAAFATPALTTINSGRDWVAREAVNELAERIAGAELQPRVLLSPHRLVVRHSA